MNAIRILIVITVLSSCLAGCTLTQGRKISTAQLQAIEKGKTTMDEVQQILGPPEHRINDLSGKTIFTYMYHEKRPPIIGNAYGAALVGSAGRSSQVTTVVFDPSGRVASLNSQSSGFVDRGYFGSDAPGAGVQPWKPASVNPD